MPIKKTKRLNKKAKKPRKKQTKRPQGVMTNGIMGKLSGIDPFMQHQTSIILNKAREYDETVLRQKAETQEIWKSLTAQAMGLKDTDNRFKEQMDRQTFDITRETNNKGMDLMKHFQTMTQTNTSNLLQLQSQMQGQPTRDLLPINKPIKSTSKKINPPSNWQDASDWFYDDKPQTTPTKYKKPTKDKKPAKPKPATPAKDKEPSIAGPAKPTKDKEPVKKPAPKYSKLGKHGLTDLYLDHHKIDFDSEAGREFNAFVHHHKGNEMSIDSALDKLKRGEITKTQTQKYPTLSGMLAEAE